MKKRKILMASLLLGMLELPAAGASGQLAIAAIIKAAVSKAIEAADLDIQKMQTQEIELQETQKVLENQMAGSELTGIQGWMQKETNLFNSYYLELQEVKGSVSGDSRVARALEEGQEMVQDAKQEYGILNASGYFSGAELDGISQQYSGILEAAQRQLDQLSLVITNFSTQMPDAGRLGLINQVAESIDQEYSDLKAFTNQSLQLALQRAKEAHDLQAIGQLYNIQNQ